MDWMWAALFVVGVVQLTYGRDNIQSITTPRLVRRNIVSRTGSGEVQQEKDATDEVFPGRVLYHVHDALRTPHSSSLPYADSSSDNLEAENYVVNDPDKAYQGGKAYQGAYVEDDSGLVFGDRSQQPILSEEWNNRYGENIEPSTNENISNDLRDNMTPLNAEERFVLQKRLQMKGMGLLGSPRGKPSSLIGFSKSPSKGLVLSIDLGIKALRDAILHAKVQQKNRQHQMQAQKNMRLLHNIGKRRAQSTTVDRP